jgi:integrase
MHSSHEGVAAALSLSGKARNKAFDQLRKKGIFEKNQELMRSGSTTPLIREREPLKNTGIYDMKACGSCKGFFSKSFIWKHRKTCSGTDTTPSAIHVGLLALPEIKMESTFTKYLLAAFRGNPVGDICRSDWLIQAVGQHQWAKNVKEDKTGPMTAMRRLAHMVIECRKIIACTDKRASEAFQGEDLFKHKNFNILTDAYNNYTYNEEEQKNKASLQVGISYLLRGSAETLYAIYLIREEDEKADEVQKFMVILKSQWSEMTNKANHAILIRSQEITRRPINLPLEEDIKAIKDYTVTACDQMLNTPGKIWSTHDFNQLRTLLVCRVTLFNARRSGEPAKLLLTAWQDAENDAWIDPRAAAHLSRADQLLVGQYKLTYMPGKGKTLVPVLFPEDVVKGLQKLVALRDEVSINKDNKFLFAATRGSTRPVLGNQCISAVCLAAGIADTNRVTGAKEESRVTATKVRHRASTIYAGLDVPEKDRVTFYKHMGHSAQINADNYQCPQAIQEVITMGKHLRNMDTISENNGKNVKFKYYC